MHGVIRVPGRGQWSTTVGGVPHGVVNGQDDKS